jgi:hypothetical protein
MNQLLESKIENTTSDLNAALVEVEQRCQEIRWRLNHFPIDQIVTDLETEIESLLGEAGRVGVLYGEVRVLARIEAEARDDDGSSGDEINDLVFSGLNAGL